MLVFAWGRLSDDKGPSHADSFALLYCGVASRAHMKKSVAHFDDTLPEEQVMTGEVLYQL